MTKYVMALGMAGALLAAGWVALPVQASKASSKEAGSLVVYGNAESKLFTQDGIDRAKSAFAGVQFDHGLHLTIDTYAELPEGKKAAFAALGEDKDKKAKFYKDWARERAAEEKAKGPYILINRKPGHIEVLVDRESHDRGFTPENQSKLREILQSGFQSAKDKPEAEQLQIRDTALKSAIDFVISDLKGTTVATTASAANHNKPASSGMGITGWICLGVVGLLVLWLVIGVIRAFTGGGGGGGSGGGGGGGGFMTSMFGGLFGAMAGMWLYNSMFGGGGMFGGGSDAYAGDGAGDAGGGDTGAGDYSGDAGSGGDYDGGGDVGGGGGDWGGGGGDF